MKNANQTEETFDSGTYAELKLDVCDCCSQHSSGVMQYSRHVPVSFYCGQCDRDKWELVGNLEKEQWLNGEW